MTLIDHLEELKRSAIKIALTVLVGFMISYALSDQIAAYLLAPLESALGSQKGEITFMGVFDKVVTQFLVAFWAGILLSAPIWFYHVWSFIKPGLYENEVKVIRPFLLVGFFLFCLGVCFGYFVVFPLAFETLMGMGVENLTATINFKEHLVLSTKILLFLGLMFQLPNVLLILGFMGMVTKYSLKEKRRYVYAGFSVMSAFFTPPDIITMLGLWVPLVFLYELGIIAVSLIVHPYLKKQHISQGEDE